MRISINAPHDPSSPARRPAPARGRVSVLGVAAVLTMGGVAVADAAPSERAGSAPGARLTAGPAPAPVIGTVSVPTDPFRILDTRTGIGTNGSTGRVGPEGTITLQVAGVGPVPADATGIVINLTVADGDTTGSYITAWPTGTPRQQTSVINITAGQSSANMVTANLGDGKLNLYNFSGHVHLIADVAAYLRPAPSPVTAFAIKDGPTSLTQDEITSIISIGAHADGPSDVRLPTVPFPARIEITGSVVIVLRPTTSSFFITCTAELSRDGGPFEPVGIASVYEDSEGGPIPSGTSQPVSINTMVDAPPGVYDARIVCRRSTPNPVPFTSASSLSFVAYPR